MMVEKTDVLLCPDVARVIIRSFSPPGIPDRIERIIGRILVLDDQAVRKNLALVMKRFATRHDQIQSMFLRHFDVVAPYLITDILPSHERQLLIGAYFTSDYALESAALFNPSIVLHRPNNSGFGKPSVWYAESLDLLHWGNHKCILRPRDIPWESLKIGGGAPSVKTPDG